MHAARAGQRFIVQRPTGSPNNAAWPNFLLLRSQSLSFLTPLRSRVHSCTYRKEIQTNLFLSHDRVVICCSLFSLTWTAPNHTPLSNASHSDQHQTRQFHQKPLKHNEWHCPARTETSALPPSSFTLPRLSNLFGAARGECWYLISC